MIEPPRCVHCDHFSGSHIGEDGSCIVERVNPRPDLGDIVQGPTAMHPGCVVTTCGCAAFVRP